MPGKSCNARVAGHRATTAPRSLEFNHAMIYSVDVAAAAAFYCEALGFRLIEAWGSEYARLRSPGGTTTIALHRVDRARKRMDARREGIRLYFEVKDVAAAVRHVRALGHSATPPRTMPWGWTHAYLRDPDGHEISLYRAGAKRLRPTKR